MNIGAGKVKSTMLQELIHLFTSVLCWANRRKLIDMKRSPKRKNERLPVIWIKDEKNNWEDMLLEAFALLFGDDPLPPVDKPIDLGCKNSHHVDN
jgi:hypothetical protein